MYSLYSLGVRITPRGVDELPLTAIEVKNQQNQLNQQENKSIITKHITEGERRGLLETKMGKTRRRRLQMEEPGSYEALSVGEDPSGRSR